MDSSSILSSPARLSIALRNRIVGFPSRKSENRGFPNVFSSPNTPSRSSCSWKAYPSSAANAERAATSRRFQSGEFSPVIAPHSAENARSALVFPRIISASSEREGLALRYSNSTSSASPEISSRPRNDSIRRAMASVVSGETPRSVDRSSTSIAQLCCRSPARMAKSSPYFRARSAFS